MQNKPISFHIVGDSYVDIFCFVNNLPELGGDTSLIRPIQTYAGGSTINTATHLQHIIINKNNQYSTNSSYKTSVNADKKGNAGSCCTDDTNDDKKPFVVVQTMLNSNDEYGKLLLRHSDQYSFNIINCLSVDDYRMKKPNTNNSSSSNATSHCVVIVSDDDRSFMTHRGCAEHFTAKDLHVNDLIEYDGPIHIHVAGYYCTPGFSIDLKDEIIRLQNARKEICSNYKTIISVVTQFDASQQWDGGLLDLIPFISFLIMNELEANKIIEKHSTTLNVSTTTATSNSSSLTIDQWVSFFSLYSSKTIFVITRGADGAIAFQNNKVLINIGPAPIVNVVDPTGAGDAFAAGFLYGLWKSNFTYNHNMNNIDNTNEEEKWSVTTLTDALMWGCSLGSSAVTVRGASTPSSLSTIKDIYSKQCLR